MGTIKKKVRVNVHGVDSNAPVISVTTRLRQIGNSQGVILNNRFLSTAGLKSDDDIVIHAKSGMIVIMPAKNNPVNTNLSTWDTHFKQASKKGAVADNDLFEGLSNEFDKSEW